MVMAFTLGKGRKLKNLLEASWLLPMVEMDRCVSGSLPEGFCVKWLFRAPEA